MIGMLVALMLLSWIFGRTRGLIGGVGARYSVTHATCAYSWISLPSRSRRATVPPDRATGGSAGPSGGACPKPGSCRVRKLVQAAEQPARVGASYSSHLRRPAYTHGSTHRGDLVARSSQAAPRQLARRV
jgi:hypothetical protein